MVKCPAEKYHCHLKMIFAWSEPSFFKTFRYLVKFIIPSLGHNLPAPLRVKQTQNIFFGWYFGAYRIRKALRGSPILCLTYWDLLPCTSKWFSSEKQLYPFFYSPFFVFFPYLGVFFFIATVCIYFLQGLLAFLPGSRSRFLTVDKSTLTPTVSKFLWRSLLAEVESSRTSLASRTSSRTHFEVLGLEGQVLGLGVEASSPRKLACSRLEDSTIFWIVKI